MSAAICGISANENPRMSLRSFGLRLLRRVTTPVAIVGPEFVRENLDLCTEQDETSPLFWRAACVLSLQLNPSETCNASAHIQGA